MLPKVKAALFDIQHAAISIGMFAAGKSLADYETDLMLRLAIERQFEIIGEAMTRDTVKHDVTWRIIHEKLPVLRAEVDALLKQ